VPVRVPVRVVYAQIGAIKFADRSAASKAGAYSW